MKVTHESSKVFGRHQKGLSQALPRGRNGGRHIGSRPRSLSKTSRRLPTGVLPIPIDKRTTHRPKYARRVRGQWALGFKAQWPDTIVRGKNHHAYFSFLTYEDDAFLLATLKRQQEVGKIIAFQAQTSKMTV